MCITIPHTKTTKARKDIITFKVLNYKGIIPRVFKNYFNINYGTFTYILKRKYSTELGTIRNNYFNSYLSDDFKTTTGFYSYRNQVDASSYYDDDEVIVECIIPKNSFYYRKDNIFVSDTIIIKRVIVGNYLNRVKAEFNKY